MSAEYKFKNQPIIDSHNERSAQLFKRAAALGFLSAVVVGNAVQNVLEKTTGEDTQAQDSLAYFAPEGMSTAVGMMALIAAAATFSRSTMYKSKAVDLEIQNGIFLSKR